MERAKHFTIICVCLLLTWPIAEIALTVREFRRHQASVAAQLHTTLRQVHQASDAIATTAQIQARLAADPANQQRLELTLAHFHRLVKRADLSLKLVNQQLIPTAQKTLESSNAAIIQCTDGITLVLADTDSAIRDIRLLLASPALAEALQSLAATAGHTAGTAAQIEATSGEVRRAIPELLASLQMVAASADRSTAEVAKFLTRLNQPLTRKEKLLSVLLRIITASGPSVVELLRR